MLSMDNHPPNKHPSWTKGGPSHPTHKGGRLFGQKAQLMRFCALQSSSGTSVPGPGVWAFFRAWALNLGGGSYPLYQRMPNTFSLAVPLTPTNLVERSIFMHPFDFIQGSRPSSASSPRVFPIRFPNRCPTQASRFPHRATATATASGSSRRPLRVAGGGRAPLGAMTPFPGSLTVPDRFPARKGLRGTHCITVV